MIIGERLRSIREFKNLSQGDIEKRTGLVRCHISRVENGHTIPAVETLEKLARALEIPLYQVLFDGEEPPKPAVEDTDQHDVLWGNSGQDARYWRRLKKYLSRMGSEDRELILCLLEKMVEKRSRGIS